MAEDLAVDDDVSGLPIFIKMIFDLQKLVIPGEFMKRYGGNLSDVVHLNVPSGAVWEVKLEREKGKAWLQNGWPEFVSFYSIMHTYVLKFIYEGNSCFHVIIMSNSASEIEYPVDITTTSRPTLKRKHETTKTTSPTSTKRAKIAATVADRSPKKVVGRKCFLSPDEIQRVEEYPCKQPSFVVKIQPSQVEPRFHSLNIPLEFVRRYWQHEPEKLVLQSATRKTWSVTCKTGITHVQLTNGWRNFARDNKLHVGDICIFELVKGSKTKFQFSILPVAWETPRSDVRIKLENVD